MEQTALTCLILTLTPWREFCYDEEIPFQTRPRGTEWFIHLLKVTQLVSKRAGIQTQAVWLWMLKQLSVIGPSGLSFFIDTLGTVAPPTEASHEVPLREDM